MRRENPKEIEDFRSVLVLHFQRLNKFQSPAKPFEENGPGRKHPETPQAGQPEKEEQKVPSPGPKAQRDLGSRKCSDAGSQDKQLNDDDLTPRLENPVMMLKRKPSSENDEIPCERYGPVKMVPLWQTHNICKAKCRLNRSQLLSNNRSTYAIYTPSLGSHE